ncbi:MAG TPA: hypothetical protein VD794_03675 [Flavisolibacter sp.]|nr:hypothetical protein [Flavisolibacter sp.]
MKKRIRVFFNFFAFNLLFFALYLNFIYEDAAAAMPVMLPAERTDIQTIPSPTMIAPIAKEKAMVQRAQKRTAVSEKDSQALKLSMN